MNKNGYNNYYKYTWLIVMLEKRELDEDEQETCTRNK